MDDSASALLDALLVVLLKHCLDVFYGVVAVLFDYCAVGFTDFYRAVDFLSS